MHKALLILSVLMLAACSFKPMSVYVQPKLVAPQSVLITAAQPVWLDVLDQRAASELGSRSISGKTAAITAQNDLTSSIREAFSESYAAQGFTFVAEKAENVPELQLILVKTDYVSQSKALKGTTTTLNTELRVKASHGAKSYEKSYRSSAENKTTFTPMQEAIQEMVNNALSDVLQRAANDQAVQALLLAKE